MSPTCHEEWINYSIWYNLELNGIKLGFFQQRAIKIHKYGMKLYDNI